MKLDWKKHIWRGFLLSLGLGLLGLLYDVITNIYLLDPSNDLLKMVAFILAIVLLPVYLLMAGMLGERIFKR